MHKWVCVLFPLPSRYVCIVPLPLHASGYVFAFLPHSPATPYQMCEATIEARSFLMHQVRCMMSLLFLVGNGLEQPSIVAHVLDIERYVIRVGYTEICDMVHSIERYVIIKGYAMCWA